MATIALLGSLAGTRVEITASGISNHTVAAGRIIQRGRPGVGHLWITMSFTRKWEGPEVLNVRDTESPVTALLLSN